MKIEKLLKSASLVICSSVIAFNAEICGIYAVEKEAEINESNILEILDEYDPDGAYILRSSAERGDDYLTWFDGEETIIAGIGTAVHEETHGYIMQAARADEEEIYIGNQNSIHVDYTEIYSSSEMAAEVPEELQTFRFDTYVGEPETNMASDIDGVYGLLNEFDAYCWDLNNTVCLYDYYKAEANSDDDWLDYANLCNNGRMAYAEFNFYILNYLKYAAENYPDIYNEIMSNSAFAEAYITVENKYHNLVEAADNNLNEVTEEYDGSIDGEEFHVGNYFTHMTYGDYNRLTAKISEEEYQKIYNELANRSAGSASVSTTAAAASSAVTATTAVASSAAVSSSASQNIIRKSITVYTGDDDNSADSLITVGNAVLVLFWIAAALAVILIIKEVMKKKKVR